jgi:hypothetical protein
LSFATHPHAIKMFDFTMIWPIIKVCIRIIKVCFWIINFMLFPKNKWTMLWNSLCYSALRKLQSFFLIKKMWQKIFPNHKNVIIVFSLLCPLPTSFITYMNVVTHNKLFLLPIWHTLHPLSYIYAPNVL